jgi:hypothetical protein
LLPSFLPYLFQNSICTLYSRSIPCIIAVAENNISFSCGQERVYWVFPEHELNLLFSIGIRRCFKYNWISH